MTKEEAENFKISLSTQESLLKLFDKYKNNSVITKKIQHFVTRQLPQTIGHSEIEYQKKQKRDKLIAKEKTLFVHKFINCNQYCFIPTSGLFLEYDKNTFKLCNEDDIQHKILTKVSNEKTLLQWKYQIKTTIIKEIKSTTLFKIIPESITIQTVLENMFPTIFISKEWVKYFLTVIGDNILKKNTELIHFMNPEFKILLTAITEESSKFFSSSFNPTDTIKLKYHDHSLEKCRIIDINKNMTDRNFTDCVTFIKSNVLDIIAVATYYSERYESSDKYVRNTLMNSELYNRVFLLYQTPIQTQIDRFVIKYISLTNVPTSNVKWDEVLFLWKYNLKQNNLPNIIFYNSLKEILIKKFKYNEKEDHFEKCHSTFIDKINIFNEFWSGTIKTKRNEELEVEEIHELFKIWYKKQKKQAGMPQNILSEINIIDVITHFHKNIITNNDKFILNVKCDLWDKTGNIKESLLQIKTQNKESNNLNPISIDKAYKAYCKHHKKKKGVICNKQFFGKKVPTLIDIKHIDGTLILPSYWE